MSAASAYAAFCKGRFDRPAPPAAPAKPAAPGGDRTRTGSGTRVPATPPRVVPVPDVPTINTPTPTPPPSRKERGAPLEMKCRYCGETFVRRYGTQMYCSVSCRESVELDGSAALDDPRRHLRKCHDCGKPTPDYRCNACRERFYARHAVTGSFRTGDADDYACYA